EILRRVDSIQTVRQDNAARSETVVLWVIDALWSSPVRPQVPCRRGQKASDPDDHCVCLAEMLLRSVDDRAHALYDCLVLDAHARNPGITRHRALRFPVDQVVIPHVLSHAETAKEATGLWQIARVLASARACNGAGCSLG